MNHDEDLRWVDDSMAFIQRTTPEQRAKLVGDVAAYLRLLRNVEDSKSSELAKRRLWRRISRYQGIPTLVKEANCYARAAVTGSGTKADPARPRKERLLRMLTSIAFAVPVIGVPAFLTAGRYADAANVFMLAPTLFGTAFLAAAANSPRGFRWFVRTVVGAFGLLYSLPFFFDSEVGALAPISAFAGVCFAIAVDMCTAQRPARPHGRRWWQRRRGEHVSTERRTRPTTAA